MTPPNDVVGTWDATAPGTWRRATVTRFGTVEAIDAQDGHRVIWGATLDWVTWMRSEIAAGRLVKVRGG